jgi:hypothetical protein
MSPTMCLPQVNITHQKEECFVATASQTYSHPTQRTHPSTPKIQDRQWHNPKTPTYTSGHARRGPKNRMANGARTPSNNVTTTSASIGKSPRRSALKQNERTTEPRSGACSMFQCSIDPSFPNSNSRARRGVVAPDALRQPDVSNAPFPFWHAAATDRQACLYLVAGEEK